MSTVAAVALAILALTSSANAYADDACADVLKYGIFDTSNTTHNTSLKTSFHQLECTSSWQTHKEAIGAGIGVGVPVYGVPIKIDAVFSKEERDKYQAQHCNNVDKSLSYDEALSIFTRIASPTIVAAWRDCIAHPPRNPSAWSCNVTDVTKVGAKLQISFASDDASAEPKISDITFEGVRPVKGLRKGIGVPRKALSFTLERKRGLDGHVPPILIKVTTTSNGFCEAYAPHLEEFHTSEKTIFGTATNPALYATDEAVRSRKITIPNDTVIRVARGHTLILEAHEIKIGRNVFFSGKGETGNRGEDGTRYIGDSQVCYNAEDCTNHLNHCMGDPGSFGKPGENGKQGGSGATIILIADSIIDEGSRHDVSGGDGGAPGNGGQGKLLYDIKNHVFRGHCPSGADGKKGGDGPDGRYEERNRLPDNIP